MRASAEIIGNLVLVAVVVMLGLAFLSLFVSQYQSVAAERLKVMEVNKIKVNLDMGVIYSKRNNTHLVYLVEFVNIGEETSFYIAPAWGKLSSNYAVLGQPALNAYLVRAVSHLSVEQCPATVHCIRAQGRVNPDRIFTEGEISLAELGSRRAEAPLVRIDLPTRGSKIVLLTYRLSDRSAGESPLVLLLASVNNKYYLASVRELPMGE
ncbi:MAG: hypothetical protein NZ902_06020 [Acidilobaceae archaeon]|nr:hypothetical protein [Acidilobaceae archaeon]MDW7974764.1 hypothetical protein [Sulfolobales archaeon]